MDEVQALEDDITRYRSADLSGTATPTNDMAHLKTHNPSSSSASSSSNFKRYSLSTMPSTSAAFSNSRRTSRSGSQVVSPYNDPRASVSNMSQPLGGHVAPQSVPGSDQNSDVEASDEDHAPALSSYRQKAGAKWVHPCHFTSLFFTPLYPHPLECDAFTCCADWLFVRLGLSCLLGASAVVPDWSSHLPICHIIT